MLRRAAARRTDHHWRTFVAKRGRPTGTLAQLERQLADLTAQRHRVIAQIRTVVERLTHGSAAPMAGLDLDARVASVPRGRAAAKPVSSRRRRVSSAVRARLSQLAKARWAKAKKEGKTRLG